MLNKSLLFLTNYFFIKIPIKIYLVFILIKDSYLEECEKSAPIKKSDNNCYLTYCTPLEFAEETCIISNSIIKTQWLTNIIKVGLSSFRFIKFAISSKNDLLVQVTSYPSTNVNYFFGLNSLGKPYFTFSGKSLSIIGFGYDESSIKTRYNGELKTIILNDNEKEYLMSVGKDDNLVEIFDFDNNEVMLYYTKIMTTYNIRSKKFSILDMYQNYKHYYLFAFIGKGENDDENSYVLQRFQFFHNDTNNKTEYIRENFIKFSNLDNEHLKYIVSCFETENKLIVCFYYNSTLYYTASLYDSNLLELNSFDFEKPSNDQHLYYECIHLKKEIGIFYYFLGNEENRKPILDIIEFVKYSKNDYKRNYLFKALRTKKDNIKDSIYFNSILKLNDNKFGIIQLDDDKKELYIIIYNIFNNDEDIIARYYTINLFKLYNLKVYNDIETILYNNFLIAGFSFYKGEENNCTNSYSSIIMFSYPYVYDLEINLIEYLQINNYTFPLNEIIKNKTIIDNNVFGLIIKGIKIQLYPKNINSEDIISLYSILYSEILKENDIIDKNDNIEFYFPREKIFPSEYAIQFAPVVTEPEYDIYNSYCEIDSDNGDINFEKKNFEKFDYIGKTGIIYIKVDSILTQNCNDSNCFYCLGNDIYNCIIYKKEIKGEKEEDKESKIYSDISSNKNEDESLDEEKFSNIYNKLKSIIEEKSYDGNTIVMDMKDVLLQLSSVEFQEDNINDQNVTNVLLGECKDILKEKYKLKDDEVLLILKLDLFKKNSSTPLVAYEVYNYNNSEKLNLEYCNNIKINVFVPIQLDNQTIYLYNNLNSSGYNLFDSSDSFYTDICSLYTTINGTDITLIDRLNDYYNQSLILCEEDGCTYDYYDTTLNKIKCECSISKTAITEENKNSEEENSFITTIVEIYNNKDKIRQIFSLSIKNMNFKVMKCFHLVFSLKYFIKNIGSILLSILIVLYLLLMILYFFLGNKILKNIINDATITKKTLIKKKSLKFKKDEDKDNIFEIKKKTGEENKPKIKRPIKKIKTIIVNNICNNISNQIILNEVGKNNDIIHKSDKKLNEISKGININQRHRSKFFKSKTLRAKINCPPPKYDKKKFLNGFGKFLKNTKAIKFSDTSVAKDLDKNNNDLENKDKDKDKEKDKNQDNDSKIIKLELKEGEKSFMSGNNSEIILSKNLNLNNKKKKKSRFNNREKNEKDYSEKILDSSISKKNLPLNKNLNDEELNTLFYGQAIIIDKRTLFQYYWSLLKKKLIILFAFYPSNDYNIRIIKISFFIVSFSLYMTINGFFFSDSTMHKVYETNGEFNIVYQIPQILYSTLVSIVINKSLKYLSLSEKSILDLKREKNKKIANDKSQKIEKCLKIKLFIYFILGCLLMLFFWYFISTFCAVYSNTQIILIKNTLISFSISMVYPLGYALIPGLFRIPALRAKNQDQECIYKLSQLVALI